MSGMIAFYVHGTAPAMVLSGLLLASGIWLWFIDHFGALGGLVAGAFPSVALGTLGGWFFGLIWPLMVIPGLIILLRYARKRALRPRYVGRG